MSNDINLLVNVINSIKVNVKYILEYYFHVFELIVSSSPLIIYRINLNGLVYS